MGDDPGPFEILEIPAVGAYGAVAVARYHAGGGRVVALKVLRTDYLNRPRILARARDEARMLFRLRHPNIIRVEELINVGGRPVLVMEWVEGVSLRALLDRPLRPDGRLQAIPVAVALEIVRQTALALDAAYNSESDGRRLRIIHRDIKPSNLLLSLGGELKVVDFGVARGDFDDREASTVSTILGTQGYIAPERLDGVEDSPAVDVYALGITLAELLTGTCMQLPRTPERHAVVLRRSLDALQQALAPLAPEGVVEAVVTLVARMCRHDHAERPAVQEVEADLAALLALLPHASGPSRPFARELSAFALQHAVPIYNARRVVPPREHPDWPELAFLEDPWVGSEHVPRAAAEVPTTNVDADTLADRKVRRFLQQPDWPERLKELTWLLATNTGWTELPFLEVLAGHDVPWWRIWARRPRPAELVASLRMLRYRRTPRVLERVRGLTRHHREDVAKAAQALVDDER